MSEEISNEQGQKPNFLERIFKERIKEKHTLIQEVPKSQVETNEETLPAKIENRVLILGARISGAHELAAAFRSYLEEKGIPEPNVQYLRDAAKIEEAFLGRETLDEGRKSPNPPKGVILLPYMRQYDNGKGMFLSTYECGISNYVEELCAEQGIPLIKIREINSQTQILQGLKELFEPKSEE